MAIKEIQIHQLPEVDKITNENVFVIEEGTTTYKITGQTLINYIKTHSDIKNIYIDKDLIGTNNGIAPINADGKIDSQYISYGNVSGTAYEGSSGKLLEDELTAHKQDSSNPHGVNKEQVGLGNVENKSSEDIRGELTFDNVTKALGFTPEIDGSYENSVAYTDKAIADLIGGAEEDLNTLKELSDAIKESKSVVEALNEAIGKKANEAEFDSHVKDTAVHLSSTDKDNITTSIEHAKSDHARSDATKTERSTTNGNIKINGTETAVYQHPTSGVTAGTYRQVTVDSEGHVTGGNNTTLPLTQGGTGATTAAQALSNLGVSATAEELNKLDGATVSVTEINQLKGITSNIQTQLDGKASTSHGNHVPDVTAESSGAVVMSDGTNYEWKKLEKQDIVDALGYVPGTGSIIYTSVKGENETEYRTGEVNITKDNIGLGKVDNTSDNEKSVLSATKLSNARKIGNASFDGTKDITLKETGALDPIGDEFNSSLTYVVGDFCIYNNTLYKCTTAINTAGEWDESKWEATTVATELSLGSDNSVTLTRAEYDALSDEEKDSDTTYYISDGDAQSNAFSVPFTSDKYTATNTGDALIEVKTELEETNSNLSALFMTGWNEIINGWGLIAGSTWDVNVHDLTFKPDGYTPIAIMGYSLGGQNADNINVFSLSIDTVSKQIAFGAKNLGSTDVANAVVSIQVLYAKTSSLV